LFLEMVFDSCSIVLGATDGVWLVYFYLYISIYIYISI
jgi:hypothetical protein